MKSTIATRQEYTFNKNIKPLKNRIVNKDIIVNFTKTVPLKLCTQRIQDRFSDYNEKKSEQTMSNITRKIDDYGKDLMALMLIILIPTIPFWQL